MLRRLLGLSRYRDRVLVDGLYDQIVAAARLPRPYSDWGVPDTPLGRFELLSVHVFLFMHRVRGEGGAVAEMAQELVDEFFQDIDHSLRELGIGDQGVPKRMKKLARMFYGRVDSYGKALDAEDRKALADALARNIRPDLTVEWDGALPLADYIMAARKMLGGQSSDEFLAGRIVFHESGKQEEAA